MSAAAARTDILDPRGQFKSPLFNGKREDFENWIFRFESYTGMLGWERTITVVATRTDAVEEELLDDDQEAVSRALYHLLVTVVSGPALSLVKLTPRGHGFEALRRL